LADDFDSLVAGLLSTPTDKGASPPKDTTGDPPKDDGSPAATDTTPDASDASQDGADNSDEPARQPDTSDADGGEDQGDGGTDTADTEPLYTVKIDGKDTTVKLSEALAGYTRQADYTRKTQELAAQRAAQEAEAAATREARGRYETILGELERQLGPVNGERTEAQWNELRATKPAEYAQEYTDFLRRQEQRAAIKREQDRIGQQKQAEQVQTLRNYVASQRTVLEKDMPEFFDTVKGPKLKEGIRKLGIENYGFTEQELDRTYDARVLKMARDALNWHNHVAAQKAAKAKLADAPAINREPGAKQIATPKTKKAAADQAAMKRLEKSGSIEDAMSLILKK
jgi:hypothetical protein